MKLSFDKITSVKGELTFKGDKSISHRAVFFSSMAEGISTIFNLSGCEDVNSTINAFELLGAKFNYEDNKLIVKGIGKNNFIQPVKDIYCGNSGTTARLISGILASQKFQSTITGDDSLSLRPMRRIIEPLEKMGAKISHNNFKLPITFSPIEEIRPIRYELKIPSAQVKSAILIAGLFNDDFTEVIETVPSRDHTERMLNLDFKVQNGRKRIFSSSRNYPCNNEYSIPGDISSASFFIVLAILSDNSNLLIKNISLNPTRIAFIDILKQMGADILIEEIGVSNGEPFGNIKVSSSRLKNIEIPSFLIPNLIDEIPILSVAGVFAEGDFCISNATELRFKETDRISALCKNYASMGLSVDEFEDGFSISGKVKNQYGVFKTFNDHRIAMTFSIFSMLLDRGGEIDNAECTKVSNPDFFDQIRLITNI